MAVHNFFKKVTITNNSFAGNATVSIEIPYQKSFSIVNEGSAVVEYSFDGSTLHGDMTPNSPTAAIFFDNRTCRAIWFRTATPGQVVRVEAW